MESVIRVVCLLFFVPSLFRLCGPFAGPFLNDNDRLMTVTLFHLFELFNNHFMRSDNLFITAFRLIIRLSSSSGGCGGKSGLLLLIGLLLFSSSSSPVVSLHAHRHQLVQRRLLVVRTVVKVRLRSLFGTRGRGPVAADVGPVLIGRRPIPVSQLVHVVDTLADRRVPRVAVVYRKRRRAGQRTLLPVMLRFLPLYRGLHRWRVQTPPSGELLRNRGGREGSVPRRIVMQMSGQMMMVLGLRQRHPIRFMMMFRRRSDPATAQPIATAVRITVAVVPRGVMMIGVVVR